MNIIVNNISNNMKRKYILPILSVRNVNIFLKLNFIRLSHNEFNRVFYWIFKIVSFIIIGTLFKHTSRENTFDISLNMHFYI